MENAEIKYNCSAKAIRRNRQPKWRNFLINTQHHTTKIEKNRRSNDNRLLQHGISVLYIREIRNLKFMRAARLLSMFFFLHLDSLFSLSLSFSYSSPVGRNHLKAFHFMAALSFNCTRILYYAVGWWWSHGYYRLHRINFYSSLPNTMEMNIVWNWDCGYAPFNVYWWVVTQYGRMMMGEKWLLLFLASHFPRIPVFIVEPMFEFQIYETILLFFMCSGSS